MNTMPLLNKTKNTEIEKKIKIANGFFLQFKGLMFESKKKFDYALVFPLNFEGRLTSSIHCLFVFFPIDVLYLNKDKKVVDIRKNLKPFTLFDMSKKPARYLIEMQTGKTSNIDLDDQIEWTNK